MNDKEGHTKFTVNFQWFTSQSTPKFCSWTYQLSSHTIKQFREMYSNMHFTLRLHSAVSWISFLDCEATFVTVEVRTVRVSTVCSRLVHFICNCSCAFCKHVRRDLRARTSLWECRHLSWLDVRLDASWVLSAWRVWQRSFQLISRDDNCKIKRSILYEYNTQWTTYNETITKLLLLCILYMYSQLQLYLNIFLCTLLTCAHTIFTPVKQKSKMSSLVC